MADGLARVLDAMERDDVDVLLVGRDANARFVSGAARLFLAGERAFAPGCVVVRSARSVHLLATSDAGIPAEIERANLYPLSWNPGNLLGRIAAMPGVDGARRVGVDGLTPLFEQLIGAFFGAAELVDGEALLRVARRVKTPEEIDAIRASVAVAEQVMSDARAAVRSGSDPATVVASAMESMARQGVTTAAFEPAVRRVDGVTAIDVGVLRNGWEGGLARTEPSGTAPDAHARAIAVCRRGATVAAIGRGSTVHGVGVGYEVLDAAVPLERDMVLSVATGPVRDLLRVTDGAPEILTTAVY